MTKPYVPHDIGPAASGSASEVYEMTFGLMPPGGIVSGFAMRGIRLKTFDTPKHTTLSRAATMAWLRERGFIPPSRPSYRSRLSGHGRHRRRRVVVGLVRGR